MIRTSETRRCTSLLLLVVVLLNGCASVGPGTITRDRFDYTTAIGDAEQEQLLVNIVRMRYLEAPVFLRVASIINQYSLEGSVSLSAMNASGGAPDTQSVGGVGRWIDRPTITYTPIAGRTFAQNLLRPIPPDALLALVQAGWSGEFLFRMAVRSVNGVDNESASPMSRKSADPEFREFLRLWRELRKRRVLGLRRDDSGATVKFFGYIDEDLVSPDAVDDVNRLRSLLGLEPSISEFNISYGLIPGDRNEIVLLTSSILEIISELSWRVDVPPEHVQAGRTFSTYRTSAVFDAPIFQVHATAEKPVDAYVAVYERGVWFYIEDNDLISKRTFALLQVLLSLTESSEGAAGPVVTIGG